MSDTRCNRPAVQDIRNAIDQSIQFTIQSFCITPAHKLGIRYYYNIGGVARCGMEYYLVPNKNAHSSFTIRFLCPSRWSTAGAARRCKTSDFPLQDPLLCYIATSSIVLIEFDETLCGGGNIIGTNKRPSHAGRKRPPCSWESWVCKSMMYDVPPTHPSPAQSPAARKHGAGCIDFSRFS